MNYEIGNKQSETIREPGEIQRISVAVLVNGIYNVQDGGDVVYEERTPEELARLNQLVQAAIGFNDARGDSISVDSLRFMDYSMDVGEPVSTSFVQILKDNEVQADADQTAEGLPAPAAQPRPRRAQQSGGVSGTVLEPMGSAGPDDIINIGAVHGGIHKGWINTVSGLIESQPDDSLKVVKTWLAEGM